MINPNVYLAGPLFGAAELQFNENVAERLEEFADVYLPQRDGGLMRDLVNDGLSPKAAASKVFQSDMEAINQADYLIAILDGRAIDEGVAFELGVAYSLEKRCLGLQTDSRRLTSWGNNPMITGALEIVLENVEDLFLWMENETSLISSTGLLDGGDTSASVPFSLLEE